MPATRRTDFSLIIVVVMLAIGIEIVMISAFYSSSFLAILGVAIIIGGAIILYATPSKHVPLTLLNASAEAAAANIERIILDLNLSEKGIYLPPKNLKNTESNLIFIPESTNTPLPTPEVANKNSFANEKTGAFIIPPGSALSCLFEKELGLSFIKTDFKQIQSKLPKLLVEGLELAQSVEIQIQPTTITLEIVGSVLDEVCLQNDSYPKTHKQVGCLLSSAIACALAKSLGKPVIIQNETRSQKNNITHIEYKILKG
jgi:hypothetical protein